MTVAAARRRAVARYEQHAVSWATTGADVRNGPAFELPLHPPSESAALVDLDAAVRWVAEWRGLDGVVWKRRQWASLGAQDVPHRVLMQDPVELARFAGRARHWDTLTGRVTAVVERCGEVVLPVLRRHARVLADLDDGDVARLLAAVSWLVEHPNSGLYLRQLPIEGLSTKWVESHRGLVTGLVTAVTGEPDLGLRTAPALIRVRILDESIAPCGPRDVSAPVDQLDGWALRPRVVVVVENLQTFLALPDMPGTVAAHGAGYAVDVLAAVAWIRKAQIIYWGDLDRDGFAILDRLRAHCPAVRSVLMDAETLLAHRHLWTADPTKERDRRPTRLTEDELHTYELLRLYGGVRLEQERLAWPWCVAAVTDTTTCD